MLCHGCDRDLPIANFPKPGYVCHECLDKNTSKSKVNIGCIGPVGIGKTTITQALIKHIEDKKE